MKNFPFSNFGKFNPDYYFIARIVFANKRIVNSNKVRFCHFKCLKNLKTPLIIIIIPTLKIKVMKTQEKNILKSIIIFLLPISRTLYHYPIFMCLVGAPMMSFISFFDFFSKINSVSHFGHFTIKTC